MPINIYHNPRCGKSRAALKVLQESGLNFQVILYLKEAILPETFQNLLIKSQNPPDSFIRVKEETFRNQVKKLPKTTSEVAKLLASYPILLERPVLESDNFSLVARDEKSIQFFINKQKSN